MSKIPGPKAKKIINKINKYTVPGTYAYPLVIRGGKGMYIFDVDGNKYLDFHANVGTAAVGYGDPEVMRCVRECTEKSAHKVAGQDFYCLPPGSLVIGENIKPIESIKSGDKVFTHKGYLRKVIKVHKRRYKGKLIKITPHGNNPLYFTPEHPILVKGLTQTKAKTTDLGKSVRYKIQWRKAEDIVRKKLKNRADLMHIPIILKRSKKNLGKIRVRRPHDYNRYEKFVLNPDVMRFIGYYLAEGWVHQNRGIVFSFNKKEKKFIDDIKNIAQKNFNANSSETKNNNAVVVEVFSTTIADNFKKWFGNSASSKKIPLDVLFLRDTHLLRELVKGYWRGDGTLKSKEFTAMTVSKNLAYQLRIILAKLGIFLSIYKKPPQKSKIGNRVIKGLPGYHLYIPHRFKGQFHELILGKRKEISRIDKPFPLSRKYTKHINLVVNSRYRKNFWVRIRQIETIPYEGYVYNLEVEGDNSYLVEGFSVHNCNEQSELAEKLLKIVPKSLKKVFFINSGAEAVENAMKFAYRKRGPLPGVSMKGAFHGRTLGALTFTHSKPVHKMNYPELRHILINFCTSDTDKSITEIDRVLAKNDVAFVITEVVQGEGGYNIASKKFIKNLRKSTKQYDVPLIIDEIQSGMGRTGEWWSFEHYNVTPDIMTSAKALQVGAAITTERYNPNEPGAVGSTWGGGDRIDLAVGLKTIEIIERKKLRRNARKMGSYFLKRLKEMEAAYPDKLSGSRGLGLMLGIDFPDKKKRDAAESNSFKKGLLILGCGIKSIRFCPPLIIKEEDIDKGLDIFEEVVRLL